MRNDPNITPGIYNLHELARALGYKHPNTLRYALERIGAFDVTDFLHIPDNDILVVRMTTGRIYFVVRVRDFIARLQQYVQRSLNATVDSQNANNDNQS